MENAETIAGIEARAKKLGVTLTNLCIAAGVIPSTYFRAKSRGAAHRSTLDPMLAKLDEMEGAKK